MSNLLYVLAAVAGSVLGSLVLWYRNRKPKSVRAGIDEFHRGLQALAPDGGAAPPRSGRRQRQRAS
jgi:membrane protein YqaA with SNARE-associated domain